MSNVLRMNSVRGKVRKLASPTVHDTVDFYDGSGPPRVVACPERELPAGGVPAYLAARKSGARSFVLWADEHRRERVATVVTESAAGGVATFQVLGAHGEHLGTIVREKAFRGRGLRTRWTVTPNGGPEAVGYKGRIVWWFVWWLCLPLMVAVVIFTVLDSTPGNEGGAARAPAHPVARGRQHAPGVQVPRQQAASARAGDGLAARGGADRPGAQLQRRHVGRPEDVRVVFRVRAQ